MSNLVDKYRITHKRIRRILDTHTRRLCPQCPDPCCTKPARVSEFDVLLANACGADLPSINHSITNLVETGILALRGNKEAEGYREPCDYLLEDRCAFPDDLRPFGCTRWICSYLKDEMLPSEMRELRDLLHKLGVLHRQLLESVTPRR